MKDQANTLKAEIAELIETKNDYEFEAEQENVSDEDKMTFLNFSNKIDNEIDSLCVKLDSGYSKNCCPAKLQTELLCDLCVKNDIYSTFKGCGCNMCTGEINSCEDCLL